MLLAFSLAFYFYGEPAYTALLLGSSLSDFFLARRIERTRGTPAAKRALIVSICVNLLILGVFKYADFVVEGVNALFGASLSSPGLPLPLGVSFFTFQTMSYAIDVYRGDVRAAQRFVPFAAYVTMFPQLVAGPIVRYTDVEAQLARPAQPPARICVGARRFCAGLGKKILLANLLGELHAALAASGTSVLGAWGMAVAYMLQIYFDFSGYSDMAVGLGAFLGFDFPENFNYPYIARSVTDFWRRWHMTLSRWFRDYLYIPLGGSRVSPARHIGNLFIVWAATGLWHGASWNYVLWGVYYAVLLILEKTVLRAPLSRLPAPLGRAYTLLVTLLGFVLFSNESPVALALQLSAMFGGAPLILPGTAYTLKSYALVLAAAAAFSTPLPARLAARISARLPRAYALTQSLAATAILIVCTAMLVDGSFNPFLYFRF